MSADHPAGAPPGLFISFEGIDGAGKCTHIVALAEAFRSRGRRVVETREPGGTPLAEQLRALALHQPMDALTEALLMFAARRDHLRQVIEPALARGDVVLCDRFTDATFAYQGGGRGFDWTTLLQLERMVQTTPAPGADGADGGAAPAPARPRQPDLTLWFDLPPAVAAERLSAARSAADRFESQPIAFFEAVRHGYQRRQHEAPQRIVRINADQPKATVAAMVQAAARRFLEPL